MISFVRFVLNTCVALIARLRRSRFQCGACMWCFCSCAGSTCFCSSGWTRLSLIDPGMRMWLCLEWLRCPWDWRWRPALLFRWPCWWGIGSVTRVLLPVGRVFLWWVWGSWSRVRTANRLDLRIWSIRGWLGFWAIWKMKAALGWGFKWTWDWEF